MTKVHLGFLSIISSAAMASATTSCGSAGNDAADDSDLERASRSEALQAPNSPMSFQALPVAISRTGGVNRCVDVPSSSEIDNTVLQQFDCHTGKNQDFFFILVGSNVYQIRTGISKCLTALSGVVVQRECGGGTDQRWVISENASKDIRIKNVATNQYIVPPNTNAGTQLTLGSGTSYIWRLSQDYYDRNVLMPGHSAANFKCLDIQGASLDNNAFIQQYDCHGAFVRRGHVVLALDVSHRPIHEAGGIYGDAQR